MQVDPGIFKAYDIRGVFGETLFPETASAVGKALIKVLNPQSIIVGRDGRISGPSLHQALVNSFVELGVNVIDIGMVSTDMYYYACAEKKLPGIMITASHNPKEYNGFKMVKQIPYLLSGDDGIFEVRDIILNNDFPTPTGIKGTVTAWNVMDGFIDRIISLIKDTSAIKPFKIVVDTANGMVGPSFSEFSKRLPQLQVIPMYFEPDGNFPNHGGDPLMEENRQELMRRVISEKADFGFAFDPDGDRFFCIDKTGRFVSGDFMTALLSQYFLDIHPNSPIVYDIRASYAVPNLIKEKGGIPLYNKVGHAFIKRRMVDEKAVFGGEVSGHYYFADYYYCDSGMAPMIFLLDMFSHNEITLDQIIDKLESKYFISGEINTKGVDGKAIMDKIEKTYGPIAQEVLYVDGVSMSFPDWHFNVRTSNTEPLVRLNLEATTKELMEQKRDEVLTIIRS